MSESAESAFRRGVAAMRHAAVNVCDEHEKEAIAWIANLRGHVTDVAATALEQSAHTSNQCARKVEALTVPFVAVETAEDIDALRQSLAGHEFDR